MIENFYSKKNRKSLTVFDKNIGYTMNTKDSE